MHFFISFSFFFFLNSFNLYIDLSLFLILCLFSHVILFHLIPSHSIPSHPIPSHSIPFHPIPFHPIPSHSTPSNSIPSHSTPFHLIPFHSIPSHSIPSHFISSHLIPSYSLSLYLILSYHYFQPPLFFLFSCSYLSLYSSLLFIFYFPPSRHTIFSLNAMITNDSKFQFILAYRQRISRTRFCGWQLKFLLQPRTWRKCHWWDHLDIVLAY